MVGRKRTKNIPDWKINLVLMYLREIHPASLLHIEHIYLLSGHSTMLYDAQCGQIEQNIKTNYSNIIYTKKYYVMAIATAVSKRPVVEMKQTDFLDFDILKTVLSAEN